MPALHPTILIGYGEFGAQVLTKVLVSASARGLLQWEDGGVSPADSRIRDLALIWVPDAASPGGAVFDDVLRGTPSPDIITDLFGQIVQLPSGEALQQAFLEHVDAARAHLLDVGRRAADTNRLRPGLDIIVVARITASSVFGALQRLLVPAIEKLAADPTLISSAQGSDLLNVLLFLDFEHFWDPERPMRDELVEWLKRVEGSLARPGLSRVYLSDGHTEEGSRATAWRVDEAALFLEFLLFEGLRDDPTLRRLYQRDGDMQTPLAAVGVRLFERSAGLVSRLAAAQFAQGWLEYLGSTDCDAEAGRRGLLATLAQYRPDRLAEDLNWPAFQEIVASELRRVEEALLAESFDDDNWPARVQQVAVQGLTAMRRTLVDRARARAREVTERRLTGLRVTLREAVTHALHHPDDPQTAGAVIQELEDVAAAVTAGMNIRQADAADDAPLLAGLEAVHERYRRLRAEQIDTHRLKWWWPMMAATIAAGLAPFVLEPLSHLQPADPGASFLVRRGVDALMWLAKPALVVALLWTLAFVVFRFVFQRAVERRAERAVRYFLEPERGRLADRLRAAVRDGSIRRTAEAQAAQVFRDTEFRIRAEIHKEVDRALGMLHTRVAEMGWLRSQLGEFVRWHGVQEGREAGTARAVLPAESVRYWIDAGASFEELLQRYGPDANRYALIQAEHKPFVDWSEQYSGAFLYPVTFLDRFSRHFLPPPEWRSVTGEGARTFFVESLSRLMSGRGPDLFGTAFDWRLAGTAGRPPSQSYAIVPLQWRSVGVTTVLQERIAPQIVDGVADDRMFLVRFELGALPEPV